MTMLAQRATDTAPTTPNDSAPRILTKDEAYSHDASARRALVPFIELVRQRWHLLTDAGIQDTRLKSVLSESLFILPNNRGRKATIQQLANNMSHLRWLIELCEEFNEQELNRHRIDATHRLRLVPIPNADALQWLANMA